MAIRPIQHGPTTIFVTTQYVGDAKAVQGLAVRWLPLPKLLRKHQTSVQSKPASEKTVYDHLIGGLVDQLNFFESTYIPLEKGLYLGYLKLHASINDGISIVVPENLPSVLPFVFLRSNPHVSREEWEWVERLGTERGKDPTASQLSFHWGLASAARILLSDLEVGRDAAAHRLYRLEVIEVHPDVSFLLIVPSATDVVTGPTNVTGEKEMETGTDRRGCLSIPVPVFEMVHLCTYQSEFISLYSRLSAFLDLFHLLLQQMSRAAFSEPEAGRCKSHLDTVSTYQSRLEEMWRETRWISAVTSRSRSKNSDHCIALSTIFDYSTSSASPGPSVPRSSDSPASRGRGGGEGDGESEGCGEDQSSDVGYHSDQSNGEKGLRQPVPESPDITPSSSDNTLTFSAPPKKPPRLDPALFTTPQPPVSAKSFLQPLSVQKRFSTASVTSAMMGVGDLSSSSSESWRSEEARPSTSAQSDMESQHSGSVYSSPSIGRHPTQADSVSGHVSDTELIQRFRSERRQPFRPIDQSTPRTNNLEDLSHIDQLYASFGRPGTESPTRPQPSPGLPVPPRPTLVSPTASTSSSRSGSRATGSPLSSGVLRVYAAYPCGLARGTSVKLQVTPRTTAKEILALVVQQLNKAAAAKHADAPVYSATELGDFVLVAVIGARERCLRDDFPPLQLQNPWARGKLFLRRRDDILAALEYGNEAQV